MLAGEIQLYSKVRIKGVAYYPIRIENVNRNVILTCRRIYGSNLNRLKSGTVIIYLKLTDKVEPI